jgi:hypothetical protein
LPLPINIPTASSAGTETYVGVTTAGDLRRFPLPTGAASAKLVPTFASIAGTSIASVASGGPTTILVHGRTTEGDIGTPFYMKRIASGAVAWDTYMTTTDAAGQKWEIMPSHDEFWLDWTGAPLDDFTPAGNIACDCTPHFNAFKAWARARYGDGARFPWLKDRYWRYFNDTIVLSYGNYKINAGGQLWRWRTGQHYMIIDAFDTSNGVIAAYDSLRDAGGSILEDFHFWTWYNPTVAEQNYGIWARCRVFLRNISVQQAGIYGVFIHGDGATSGGNNNNWSIDNLVCSYNGFFGLGVYGSDANAGTLTGQTSFYGNANGGLDENSFLGSGYGFLHFEGNNGGGDPGIRSAKSWSCWYDGNVYRCCLGKEVLASTTVPGTNDAIWEWTTSDANHEGRSVRAWQSGQTWYVGGDVLCRNGAASSSFFGSYHEDGSPCSEFRGQIYYFGGGFGGSVSRNSGGKIDRGGVRRAGGYGSRDADSLFDITNPSIVNKQLEIMLGGGGAAEGGGSVPSGGGSANVLRFGRCTEGGTKTGFFGMRSLAAWGYPDSYEMTPVDNASIGPGVSYGAGPVTTFFLTPPYRSDASSYAGGTAAQRGGMMHIHKLGIGEVGRERIFHMMTDPPTSSTGPFGPWGQGDTILCAFPGSLGVEKWVIERGAQDVSGYAYRIYPTSGGATTLVTAPTATNCLPPTSLALTALTSQTRSTVVTSNLLTGTAVMTFKGGITGLTSGLEYSLNGGAYTSAEASSAFGNGDTLRFRVTTSPLYSTTSSYSVTLSDYVTLTWSVGTVADATPTVFRFDDRYRATNIALSSSEKVVTKTVTAAAEVALTNRLLPSTGKWIWCRKITAQGAGTNITAGICVDDYGGTTKTGLSGQTSTPGFNPGSVAYWYNGFYSYNWWDRNFDSTIAWELTLSTYTIGDWVIEAYDATNDLYWTKKVVGGTWNGDAAANPVTGVGGKSLSYMGDKSLRRIFAKVDAVGDAVEYDFTSAALAVSGFAAISTAP